MKLTQTSKKAAATQAVKKDTGKLAMDPIDGGDMDAEGEVEQVVEVKKAGANKPKRKAKKKAKVNEDRGEGSLKDADRVDKKAKELGITAVKVRKCFFLNRYFGGDMSREVITPTWLRMLNGHLEELAAQNANITIEIEVLKDVRCFIQDGLGELSTEDKEE